MKKLMLKTLALVVALALPICATAATVAVSVQQVVVSGLAGTYTSSGVLTTDTYTVVNDGRVFLHFKKSGAGECTVTITTPGTVQGFAIADQTVTIAASTGNKVIGPFPASLFNDDSTGKISFSVSDTVGLSFAAYRL